MAPATSSRSCFATPEGALLDFPEPGVTWLRAGSVLSNERVLRSDNAAVALRMLGRSDRLVWYVADAADTADVGTTRDAAWADLCARVDDGLVVAVDYGHLADDRPPGSTLVGYRRGRLTDPVPDGSTDLTAHVAVDTLAGAVLRRQRDVLAPHAPARPTHDLARSDPARYLAELGRRGAWDALTARGGLGDFWWAMRRVRAD